MDKLIETYCCPFCESQTEHFLGAEPTPACDHFVKIMRSGFYVYDFVGDWNNTVYAVLRAADRAGLEIIT